MKLYFKDTEIGEIRDVFVETPWMYETIHLNDNSKPFQEYFRKMVDEDSTFDFESTDPEFLDDENWSVFDENEGKYLGIDIPAIHINPPLLLTLKNTTFYPITHFSLLYSPFVNIIFTTYLSISSLFLFSFNLKNLFITRASE